MTTKTIENRRYNFRPVGGDYFNLTYARSSIKHLQDFLPLFNFTDYWCFKSSRHQVIVNYQELLEFKYSGYIFFKKELYSKDHIDMWIDWMKSIGGIQFLANPFPPFNPTKIIIRK